jgi:hypothetical protein
VGSPTWKFPCAYCKQHESWQIWPSLPSTKCVWHYHRNYGVTREVLALAPCKIARCLWQESIYNNLLTMVFQILTFALMSNTRMSAGMFAKHNGKLVHQISVCPPKHMVNSGTMFVNMGGLNIIYARYQSFVFVQCAPRQFLLTTWATATHCRIHCYYG